MRTITAELSFPIETNGLSGLLNAGPTVRVSTEVIVEDSSAREAGQEAARVLTEFIAGYGEAAEDV